MYDSLKQAPTVPDEVLDYFSNEGGESLLYELRFLPVEKRTPPALYIAANGLDTRVRIHCVPVYAPYGPRNLMADACKHATTI